MLSNRKSSLLNSTSSILYQFVTALMGLVSRKVFLQFMGVELLGLSSTLSSIISIASLAETGLGTCIIFRLYSALQNEDSIRVNKLLNVARFYLSCIGVGVLFVALIFTPFLHFFIKGIEITFYIYIYFYLQVLATASSYFLAYKRLLLTADKKDFVGKFSDLASTVVFSVLRILVCIYLQNYIVYLILSWMQVVVGNLLVSFFCNNLYKYIKREKADLSLFKELWPDMKNLFLGGVAAYLFSASDNLILSTGVSTVAVGYLANYTMITTTLKTFILNLMSFMGPLIGNQVASNEKDDEKVNNYLRFYDFMLYFISAIIIIPEFVLIQDFISNVYGNGYVLDIVIVFLIIADQYITIVQDSNGVFLSVTGHFKELKIADGTAAITNIVSSILLCIPFGMAGILIGTVISRLIQWIIKMFYARNTKRLRTDNQLPKYLARTFVKIVVFTFVSVLLMILYRMIGTIVSGFIGKFVIGGAVSVLFSGVTIGSIYLINGDTQNAIRLIRR